MTSVDVGRTFINVRTRDSIACKATHTSACKRTSTVVAVPVGGMAIIVLIFCTFVNIHTLSSVTKEANLAVTCIIANCVLADPVHVTIVQLVRTFINVGASHTVATGA